jgi:hypothetical protein
MAVFFVWLLRTIGLGGCAFLGLWIYDWGIPGAARIPFLTAIPIIGDLTTGRAHTYAADQVKLATAEMVTRFERDALQAQLDKEKRDRQIAEAASARAQERADATDIAQQVADAEINRLRALAQKAKLDGWDAEELEWYFGKH